MKIKVKLSQKTKEELKGLTGVQGVQGEQGLNGDKGDKGEVGEQGVQGIPGQDGNGGKDGKRGAKGEKGDDGKGGKDGIDGADGPPDTGEQIKDKINTDTSGKKIGTEHLDLPQLKEMVVGVNRQKYLKRASNLSDLDDVATARTNLDVMSSDQVILWALAY